MSQLTPEIPFMVSLWIRSGYDMKVATSAETYQVGAPFKALIKAIFVEYNDIMDFISGTFTNHVSIQPIIEKSIFGQNLSILMSFIRI